MPPETEAERVVDMGTTGEVVEEWRLSGEVVECLSLRISVLLFMFFFVACTHDVAVHG